MLAVAIIIIVRAAINIQFRLVIIQPAELRARGLDNLFVRLGHTVLAVFKLLVLAAPIPARPVRLPVLLVPPDIVQLRVILPQPLILVPLVINALR